MLGVDEATYYRCCRKSWGPSELEEKIINLCVALKFRIGHLMVCGILRKEHNLELNRNTVQRIMQKFNIQCQVKKKRQNYLAGESEIVANILNREFTATEPNGKWMTDISYLAYEEKMIYLSTIKDLYNNEILAYTIGDKQDKALVLEALVLDT